MAAPAGTDPDHWLHRLSAPGWLASADTELAHCQEALTRRAVRPGVTHARRAAGMAINALLVLHEDPRFGRSYMDHVVALSSAADAPEAIRTAATLLKTTPAAPPQLVTLGKPDLRVLDAAQVIVEWARASVSA